VGKPEDKGKLSMMVTRYIGTKETSIKTSILKEFVIINAITCENHHYLVGESGLHGQKFFKNSPLSVYDTK